jgi:hypothetical protein
VPRAGTRVQIGRAGCLALPTGLQGNFRHFINYDVS